MKDRSTTMDKKSMTKKQWLTLQRSHRVVNGFNTGTRDMKSEKYPCRARQREIDRKECRE